MIDLTEPELNLRISFGLRLSVKFQCDRDILAAVFSRVIYMIQANLCLGMPLLRRPLPEINRSHHVLFLHGVQFAKTK